MRIAQKLLCGKNKKDWFGLQWLEVILLSVFSFNSYANVEVSITIDNYPPYVDENAENLGLITGIVQRAFLQQEIKSTINFKPWLEAESAVDNDKSISFMWHKNNERQRKWIFSQPIYRSDVVIVATKESRFHWERYDQLRNYRLGIARGQSYGEKFNQIQPYLDLRESISDYVNLKKLVARELDGIIVEKLEAEYLLSFFNERQRNSVEYILKPQLSSEPTYLVCSKTYSKCFDIINKFNKGLENLISTGEYSLLLSKSK